MARALWLAVAIALVLPPLAGAWTALTTTAFLVEFLSAGHWRPLTAMTQRPTARPLPLARGERGSLAADLYVTPSLRRPPGLVLVHGITYDGKADRQLRAAALLLARVGWAVAVPTVDGLTTLRLRPSDAESVATTVHALDGAGYRPVGILAISLGAGPALAAAARPDVADMVSAVLVLGGYASARELLRYTLTGAYRFGDIAGRRPVDEEGIDRFARANAELVEGGGHDLVANRDPAQVDRLLATLPDRTRRLLDALSPERVIGETRATIFLIHGREDPTVPFTETLRLEQAARAADRPVRAILVGAVGHVDPEDRATLGELMRSWSAFYAFRVSSAAGR